MVSNLQKLWQPDRPAPYTSFGMNTRTWIRGIWAPVRLCLVFGLAQALLPNLLLIGAAVVLVDVLGVFSFDFHGKTVADLAPGAGLAVQATAQLLALALILVAWRFVERRRWHALGWGPRADGVAGLRVGTAVGAGSVAVVFIAALAAGAVQTGWSRSTTIGGGTANAALWLAVSCVLAPLLEEVWYRGYLLRVLSEAWGVWPAVAASALTFGAIHLANPNATLLGAVNISLIGAVACAGVLALGSLWFAVAAHAAWNFAQFFIAGLPNSGIDTQRLGLAGWTLLNSRTAGSELLSGGAFGIEGSVITTAVELAVLGWLIGVYLKKGQQADRPDPE